MQYKMIGPSDIDTVAESIVRHTELFPQTLYYDRRNRLIHLTRDLLSLEVVGVYDYRSTLKQVAEDLWELL